MSTSRRILLIEDDHDIADLLVLNLSDEGYQIECAADGDRGYALLCAQPFDLLILDLMLPGMDGLEICRRARSETRFVPIIMISAKTTEPQRIRGLELGADDYLPKPFSVLELIARVRALFRRIDSLRQGVRSDAGIIEAGLLVIDPLAREAQVDGRYLTLTPREFDLLHFFAGHPGKVFSRLDLLNKVWNSGYEGYEHTVNSHINRLRAKIEPDPANPQYILTVWGVGYKFSDRVMKA